MKVDKGVCTNDAYFATNNATELNSIIKFETVFTTLVENKILSIKRECEQHENTKKSRTLKNLLLRKAELSDASKPNASSSGGNAEVSKDAKKTRKNIFLRYKNKKLCGADIDVEKGQVPDITATDVIQPSTSNEIVNVEYRNEVQQEAADNAKLSTANLDSQSNQLGLDEVSINFPVSKTIDENHDYANDDDDKRNCDKLIINSHTENAQLTLSTNSSVNNSNKNHATPPKETSPPSATTTNEESLATTIDISLQQQSSIIVVGAFNTPDKTPINASHQVNNEKSDLAICDDGASSQNTSDIEFSLVSENSISELPAQHIRKKTTNNSDPIVKKSLNLLSPPMVRGDRKTSERKAISCQSTPLFGRHQQTQTKSEGNEAKKVLTFQTEFPKKVSESKPPNIIEKAKSQTIVIAPTSSTTTTTLAPSGPAETVHLCKKSQKHSKYRDVSVDYEITYGDDGNQSPRGFISSFNQLTSQMTPAAVITTNPKKQSLKQSKTKDSREQQEAFVKTDDKTVKNHEPELELDDLAVDVVNKKKKRRRFSSRLSDPAIYPSSASGLKHCILSRPPNQPIWTDEYDAGFMYDVSLQIESEFNGEIKSIVPADHKKHRHKHHRHHHDHQQCKKKRHKKRKILVHNLDDKSLKVIDPDELPQRAKFTIIATACLLLVMCLLLVGVTLRMAPLIDDMGE